MRCTQAVRVGKVRELNHLAHGVAEPLFESGPGYSAKVELPQEVSALAPHGGECAQSVHRRNVVTLARILARRPCSWIWRAGWSCPRRRSTQPAAASRNRNGARVHRTKTRAVRKTRLRMQMRKRMWVKTAGRGTPGTPFLWRYSRRRLESLPTKRCASNTTDTETNATSLPHDTPAYRAPLVSQ
jgi:hypothetical protein